MSCGLLRISDKLAIVISGVEDASYRVSRASLIWREERWRFKLVKSSKLQDIQVCKGSKTKIYSR